MGTYVRCDRCGTEFRAGDVTSFAKVTVDERTMGKGSCERDLCRGCTLQLNAWLRERPPTVAVRRVPVEKVIEVAERLDAGARRFEQAQDAADKAVADLRALTSTATTD